MLVEFATSGDLIHQMKDSRT